MGEISTKERLVTEAMRLFGEQGYKATSVAQIEKAAGLTPGSGGLYPPLQVQGSVAGGRHRSAAGPSPGDA